MPRKGPAPRRPLVADPVYNSPLVTQLVNKVLMDGKRSIAQSIVYGALEGCRDKTGSDPVVTLKRALDNVKPALEVKSRRVGGATYQVPIEVKPGRVHHPGPALGGRLLQGPSREDHDRAADERAAGRLQRPRCLGQAARGHAQDGRVEQGLRALPLVVSAQRRAGISHPCSALYVCCPPVDPVERAAHPPF